jgi:leucyl/phenylalanyl-tRNA--protein transferase
MAQAHPAQLGRLGAVQNGTVSRLDPDTLVRAYSIGIFPMAEARDDDSVFWVEPRRRGVIPLDGFHLSRSLAKTLKREAFTHSADRDFEGVLRACAEPTPDRPDTWINETIVAAYTALHRRGQAHSIECWQDGALVGGLYGVKLGGAFFGESMFSRATDASKAAMAHLVARLRAGGFALLDTQFLTPHLSSLGGIEISRSAYRAQLGSALSLGGDFGALDALSAGLGAERPTTTVSAPLSGKLIVQLLTQTS